MLRIQPFGMAIDCPGDCGLAASGGVYLFGPTHGRFGIGIMQPQHGDDPEGDLADKYALMAAIGPVGDKGGTFINRRDPVVPFVGAIKNPHTERLYLLVPFNHVGLAENDLRKEIGRLVGYIGFVSPAMETWETVLHGRTFTAAESHQRELGSSDGYSLQEDLTFKSDGMYERRLSGHTSISSGGLSLGRVRDEREVGLWDVVEESRTPALRLENADGDRRSLSLSRTADAFFFDGRRFVRTA